jgi:hypothetical protein
MIVDVEMRCRQHLSDADRRLLDAVAGPGAPLSAAFADPAVEAAVFEADGELAATSPFLTFATAVHRSEVRLRSATHVEERWSARDRIPVFDVSSLRDLLGEPARRLFLVELLSSYTHVVSGVTWQRTSRGWRRHRFSELDPVRLAGLLETVPPEERPGIYRRLGDLALFLTGVFPDHRASFELGDAATARLLRLSGVRPDRDDERRGSELIEKLGGRWYGLARRSAEAYGSPLTADLEVASVMGERFRDARRALNIVTDWYLFPLRDRWFGRG